MTIQEVEAKYGLTISVADTNIKIMDSYKVKGKTTKTEIVTAILATDEVICGTHNRTVKSYVSEWQAHNILYNLGIKRSHTADVDLDENETKIRLFLYAVIALFND